MAPDAETVNARTPPFSGVRFRDRMIPAGAGPAGRIIMNQRVLSALIVLGVTALTSLAVAVVGGRRTAPSTLAFMVPMGVLLAIGVALSP